MPLPWGVLCAGGKWTPILPQFLIEVRQKKGGGQNLGVLQHSAGLGRCSPGIPMGSVALPKVLYDFSAGMKRFLTETRENESDTHGT